MGKLKNVGVREFRDHATSYLSGPDPIAVSNTAKELTVAPGRSVTVEESSAYGLIVVGGRGEITSGSENQLLEAPTLIRYGQLTYDEYFVMAKAAAAWVTVRSTPPRPRNW